MRKLATLLGVLAWVPTLAWAQSASAPMCERRDDEVCGVTTSVSLGKVAGDVVILANAATAAAQGGSVLMENDRVIAREGSAQIVLRPDCVVDAAQKTSALIYKPDATRICVSVSDLQPRPVVSSGPSSTVYALGAVGAAGGAAAVAIGALGSKGGKGSSTPVSTQ